MDRPSEELKIEEQLVKSILRVKYQDIPLRDIKNAKMAVMDTVGVIMAGVGFPGVGKLREQLVDWGGKKESTILGFGDKVPATSSALMNATMARVLDFDETHEEAVVHPGAAIIPGCLSIAERAGSISGREFLAAVVLGRDFVCRLALTPARGPLASGWQSSSTFGCLGVAAAASKILGLDAEKTLNALGIAYSQSSGNLQGFTEGAFTGAMQQGLGASAGVFAAIMAEKGISGAHDILEGKYGYFRVYENSGYDRNKLLKEIGTRFEGSNAAFKNYPCCRFAHRTIDITLQTIQSKRLRPIDIDEIEVGVNRQAMDLVGHPLEKKQFPETVVDAKFSIPFAVAVAIVRGRVGVEDFSERNIKDPSLWEISKKVKVFVDKEIEGKFGRIVGPAVVNFKLKNGKVISVQSELNNRDPSESGLSEKMRLKFKSCLRVGFGSLKESMIEEIFGTLGNLEYLANIGDLVKLLNFEGGH
jgi:2-methylcitrate dehydratase PrpD